MPRLGESSSVEFKEMLNDDFEKEVVAFLNSREGGEIYIGINDLGRPVEIPDLDALQLKVLDRIKNNILPSTLGLFDILTTEVVGKSVVKIIISSGVEKPYYIRKRGMSPKGCFIRVGSSAQPMTTGLIDEYYARRVQTTLRSIQSPRQDLTFAQLKIYYQEHDLKLNDQFANSLELLTTEEKYNYIAYLLADENAVSIKVAKYAGKDKVDLIENEEYGYCSLVKATYSVLERMKIENTTRAKVTSVGRIESNLIDTVALREAVVNAIVHNDFTREIPPVFEIFVDRMELTSYGGLLPGQSKEDFFGCFSMPRNRELMRVFKDLGLVEQLGSGMSRILKVYDESIFKISAHYIKVVFPFSSPDGVNIGVNNGTDGVNSGAETADKSDESRLMEAMAENQYGTTREFSEQLGVSLRKISRLIKTLRENGDVTRVGSNRKGYWVIREAPDYEPQEKE